MPSILVQCNPLLDISAEVDDEFLKKFGMAPASAALAKPEQLGVYAALEEQPSASYIPGGSGLNTARVAAWMLEALGGGQVSYIGCVGEDRHGEILITEAEKAGVHMLVDKTSSEPTGVCAVAVVGKERSLLANLGAAEKMSKDHLKKGEVSLALMNKAEIYYATGFALTTYLEQVLTIVKERKAQKGQVVFNLSAPFIAEDFLDAVKSVLPYVDVLIGNETEAAAFAKAMGWDDCKFPKAAQGEAGVEEYDLHRIAIRALKDIKNDSNVEDFTVIFTQGEWETLYAQKSEMKVKHVLSRRVPKEKVVDTNGAGDSFVGGVLAGLSAGRGLKEAIELGNYAGSEMVQQSGCTLPGRVDIAKARNASGEETQGQTTKPLPQEAAPIEEKKSSGCC